jgi:ribosomal protein L27
LVWPRDRSTSVDAQRDESHPEFWPGEGVGLGRDHTIFATQAGVVEFKPSRKGRTISVLSDS